VAAPSERVSEGVSSSKLDYSSYPHIIEEIVGYSSGPARRAVAATCRALRRFVLEEGLLLTHIWMGETAILSPEGRSMPGCILESPEYQPDEICDLSTVRVVDVGPSLSSHHFGAGPDYALNKLAPQITSLKLLRAYHNGSNLSLWSERHFSVPVVHFIELGETCWTRRFWVGGKGPSDVFINFMYGGYIPEKVDISCSEPTRTVYIFVTAKETQGGPFLPLAQAWDRLRSSLTILNCRFNPPCPVVFVTDDLPPPMWMMGPMGDFSIGFVSVRPAPTMSFAELKEQLGERMFNLVMKP
jgi:hypothetical protein